MSRDCGHSAGDEQRLRTQCRRSPETADTVQGRDDQETADTVQEITRDCGHSADGDDQETADTVQGMTQCRR
ncbi:unnamed protein product [Staurois parvus]|uniref:Uncharacterized protein n=1 Tax=Staurois parvus TaxID=386267 RepID=A0ABN9EUC6_9NEOB|nr:unnamed protein product [Staurois parvus]